MFHINFMFCYVDILGVTITLKCAQVEGCHEMTSVCCFTQYEMTAC